MAGREFKFVRERRGSSVDIAIIEYSMYCDRQTCPIADTCTHNEGGRCVLHKSFLHHIIKLIYRYEKDGQLTEHGLHTAGVLIVPLYTHLFKFYLVEMGMSSPVVYGKSIYMHPVYKEIRNTIKTIHDLWKSLGLIKDLVPMPTLAEAGAYYNLLTEDDEDADAATEKNTKFKVKDVPPSVDEDSDSDPLEDDTPPRQPWGTTKKILAGPTSQDATEKLAAMEQLTNEMEVNPELALTIELGQRDVIVPEDFDPTKLSDDAEQTSFVKARLKIKKSVGELL